MPHTRTLVLLGALSLSTVTVLVGTPAGATDAPAAAGSSTSDSAMAAVITRDASIRHQFGLSVDPGLIGRAEAQAGADRSYLGVPLTASEVAEMQRRDRVGQRLEGLGRFARSGHASTFAGT